MSRTQSIKATGMAQRGVQTCNDWIVLRRRYQAEEKKKKKKKKEVEDKSICVRQVLSEPLTRFPCPYSNIRYGAVTLIIKYRVSFIYK